MKTPATPAPTTETGGAQLSALVERLLSVPNQLRLFACDPAEAKRMYGLDERLLGELTAIGLPYEATGDGRRYSYADMHYLGLRLGTAVFHLRTFAAWARRIRPSTGLDRSRLRVHYVPHLADGVTATEGSVLLPDGRIETMLHSQQPAAEAVVSLQWSWPAIDRRLAAVIEEMSRADHYMFDLNGNLLDDEYPGCVVTDCRLSARALAARCGELGYATRWSYGMIAAPMFSVRHFWVDVQVGDVWVPVDAVVLGLLRRFQAIQPADWPATASLGGLLVRLSEDWEPIVADARGEELGYSLYTTGV